MKLLPLMSLALAFAVAPCAHAEWRVQTTLQIVQMPQADALKIVPRLLSAKSANEAYDEIQKGLEAGTFKRLAELSGNTLSGTIFEGAEGRDFSFPSDYVAGIDEIGPSREQTAKSKERISTSHAIARLDAKEVGGRMLAMPTVLEDGKLVQIHLESRATNFERWERTELERKETGVILHTRLPIFRVRRSQGYLSFAPGVPQVAAIYQIPGVAPTTELHLVTAKASKLAGLPPPAPAPEGRGEYVPWVAPNAPARHATVEMHRFHVSSKDALALRPLLLDPKQIHTAALRLVDSAAQGRAQLVDWQVLQLSSESASVDNLQERRHGLTSSPFSPGGEYSVGSRMNVGSTPVWGEEHCHFILELNIFEMPDFFRFLTSWDANGAAGYDFQRLFRSRRLQNEVLLSRGQQILLSFALLPEIAAEKSRKYEITLLRRVPRD